MPKLNKLSEIQAHHQRGDLVAAKKAYEAYLKTHTEDAEAWHSYGMLCAQQNNFAEAVTYLQRATQFSPDNPAFHVNLANAYKAQDLFHEAIQSLQLALTLEPNYSTALNNLGTVYYALEQWEEAIHAFEAAIAIQSDYLDAHYNLGLSYAKSQRLDKAVSTYHTLLQYNPENTAVNFQLGCLFLSDGKPTQALSHFLQIEKQFPEHFETQSNLATCYLQLGDLQLAHQHYLQANKTNDTDTQILFNLGVTAMQLGNIAAAVKYYQAVLKLNPWDFATQNNLGAAFLSLQQTENALKHFREALCLRPENEAIRYTIQALSQENTPNNASPVYIQNLFDSYADHYDQHLQTHLHYHVPEQLLAAVTTITPLTTPRDILDLGCGTGLCGALFKPYAKTLTGMDLSPNMLKLAERKGIYDTLIQNEFLQGLQSSQQTYDLILAGDVFVYFGDLSPLLQTLRRALRPEGLLAFNTESSGLSDYQLNTTGRFSHQKTYIEVLAEFHHFEIVHAERITSRMQNNAPVHGNLFVLKARS